MKNRYKHRPLEPFTITTDLSDVNVIATNRLLGLKRMLKGRIGLAYSTINCYHQHFECRYCSSDNCVDKNKLKEIHQFVKPYKVLYQKINQELVKRSKKK